MQLRVAPQPRVSTVRAFGVPGGLSGSKTRKSPQVMLNRKYSKQRSRWINQSPKSASSGEGPRSVSCQYRLLIMFYTIFQQRFRANEKLPGLRCSGAGADSKVGRSAASFLPGCCVHLPKAPVYHSPDCILLDSQARLHRIIKVCRGSASKLAHQWRTPGEGSPHT